MRTNTSAIVVRSLLHAAGPCRRSSESGNSLIAALLVFALLMLLGFALISTSGADFQVSGTYRDLTEARYLAESGLQTIVAKQNDTSLSPRYLFDGSTYATTGVDPLLPNYTITDPTTSESLGGVARSLVGGKNPLVNPPPYRLRSSANVRGSERTFEADIAPLSLLEYALWTEDSVSIAAYITYTGKVYSASYISLTGSPITFHRKVEYVTTLSNPSYGTFNEGNVHLTAPKPSITSLVDLDYYEDATQIAGMCDSGVGLEISSGMPHVNLFKRSNGVYQIDLTLFDFSGPHQPTPTGITYHGVELKRYDVNPAAPLIDFNGIIFVDGELHIWGINGGRSPEDYAILDEDYNSDEYYGPKPSNPYQSTTGKNLYSNNELDPGEDGVGGTSNGILDPAKLGQSLTIVTADNKNIYVDHNIFMGEDPNGIPVRMALISGRAVHVDSKAPKTIIIQAALMALGTSNACSSSSLSWYPCGDHNSHIDNYWARRADGSYVYDTDHDGTIENNNGAYRSYDRNETDMKVSWSLQVFGNRVFKGKPSSGHWAGDSHMRYYTYDDTLLIYEPPCYPVLPEYDLVPGSVAEIR